MKNKSIIFVVLFLMFLTTTISLATTRTVNMQYPSFVPETTHAFVGDTVRWINTDIRLHTTTSGINGTPNGIWNSGTMNPGDTFRFRFTSSGNYPYYCAFHYLMGMTGVIIVNIVDIKEIDALATPIVVAQNYPNPFNNKITINFELKTAGKVDVKIFDALGQLIKTLISKSFSAGIYSIYWDGTNFNGEQVQGGLFFYRINLNGTNYMGKILRAD